MCSFQLQVFSDNDWCCVQVWITGYRCLVLVTVVCRSGRQVFSVSDCCVQVWKTGVLCLMLVTVVCRSGRQVFCVSDCCVQVWKTGVLMVVTVIVVSRFGSLWKFRFQVWQRMECDANMYFKVSVMLVGLCLSACTSVRVVSAWICHLRDVLRAGAAGEFSSSGSTFCADS